MKTRNEDEQKQKANIIEEITSKYFICQLRQKVSQPVLKFIC